MTAGKNCNIGKSCGGACIDRRERCVLELGPLLQPSLGKSREAIQKAQALRRKLVERDLSWSDKDAAKWLQANLKNLENIHLKFEGGPTALWTFGIEPGMATSNIEKFNPEIIARLRQEGKLGEKFTRSDLDRAIEQNPAAVVRMARNAVEDSKLMNKATGVRSNMIESVANPNVVNRLLKGVGPSTLSPQEEIDNTGKGKVWKASDYMAKAAVMAKEVGAEKWSNGNMSMLGAPDLNVWPYGEVFKKAGMDPGVFESRNTWIKHMNSANRTGAIADSIISQKPGKVFLGGTYGKNIMKSYVQKLQEMGIEFKSEQKVVYWTSATGAPKKSTFAIITTPNTRMVFGPHFTAQVPKSVVDMRAALLSGKESGDPVKLVTPKVAKARPKTVKSASAAKPAAKPARTGVGGVWDEMVPVAKAAGIKAGDRNAGWVDAQKAVREEFGVGQIRKPEHLASLRRELQSRGLLSGSPSVLPGSQPKRVLKGDLAPSKVGGDKIAKQKATYLNMVNMWKGQGKPDTWIRDQLRTQRVPAGLINQVL